MSTTREQIISATCDLLEIQGYHATGLNQIVKDSGAPKGSLYYYFPEGKEEIAVEAIRQAGERVAERIRQNIVGDEPVAQAIPRFIRTVAHYVEVSGYQSGGPLTAVAMETATTSERLNLACRAAYGLIQAAFREKLLASGYDPEQAGRLASFITAAIEGGIILSRTDHSGDPLRNVADILDTLLLTIEK